MTIMIYFCRCLNADNDNNPLTFLVWTLMHLMQRQSKKSSGKLLQVKAAANPKIVHVILFQE